MLDGSLVAGCDETEYLWCACGMPAVAGVSGMPVVKVVGPPAYAAAMLLRDTLDEERWRRADVGCVAPVRAPVCATEGSVASSRTLVLAVKVRHTHKKGGSTSETCISCSGSIRLAGSSLEAIGWFHNFTLEPEL